ncbi:hypothetical protein [Burkholderia multivorans]|uniref:hypothetical protein n=1 Tax=Burkholderia multivorans TaxID=87883 RepID=UPI0015E329D4|nr:hypothetical protein [Burkholderia multivorans]MBU9589609.1 hypothetical protein [Burkholderia multivorans]
MFPLSESEQLHDTDAAEKQGNTAHAGGPTTRPIVPQDTANATSATSFSRCILDTGLRQSCRPPLWQLIGHHIRLDPRDTLRELHHRLDDLDLRRALSKWPEPLLRAFVLDDNPLAFSVISDF